MQSKGKRNIKAGFHLRATAMKSNSMEKMLLFFCRIAETIKIKYWTSRRRQKIVLCICSAIVSNLLDRNSILFHLHFDCWYFFRLSIFLSLTPSHSLFTHLFIRRRRRWCIMQWKIKAEAVTLSQFNAIFMYSMEKSYHLYICGCGAMANGNLHFNDKSDLRPWMERI